MDIVNGATGAFTLKDVMLYNFNKNGLLANDNTKYGASPAQPNLPTTEQKVTSPIQYNSVPATLEGEIYVFESSPPSLASIATSPRIVIKGTYNGADYYYPVDFTYDGAVSGTTKGSFMPVVRNHRYIFTISQVTGPGFASAIDALSSTAVFTNITATAFVIDEDFRDVYYSASDCLAVNAPDFDFSHEAATVASTGNKITVKSTAAWTIQCFEADGTTPAGSWLSVDMSSGSAGTTTEVSVLVSENNPIAERNGKIKITAKGFSHVVSVHQKAYIVIWAGSNIYWDGTSLTFDDVSTSGPSLHETYQGVYFKWGSLWGISPQGNWSDNSTIVYVPDNVGGYTSGIASSWSSVLYWNPGTVYQSRDEKYLTKTVHTPANIANGYGDICQYLTELAPGGTLYGKKWRMPTSNEFEAASNYSSSGTYTNAESTSADGTQPYTMGIRKTNANSIGTPFFPASGQRDLRAGGWYGSGSFGYYWSSTSAGSSGFSLRFSSFSIISNASNDRGLGFSVRCVVDY
ncbi:BACON domain-containing protein [Dysgonomonas sp. GY75]|uniref:BACON domain-containing protein n=1 Tax=Dysgonomonas sp. GY75 TaxID=2780419 RepID=UPI001A7E9FF8|nr:BACON domain-containing carbohydrate-binding protein [Dysgonomonas sp. GY75]